MRFYFSSGNLTLDKRYDYALWFKESGDFAAASDVLEQTLQEAPDWLPALSLYGDMLVKLKDPRALAIFEQLIALDAEDLFGGRVKKALLNGETQELPHAFVKGLFESYAPHFEESLVEKLAYKGPEILKNALHHAGFTQTQAMLDLGCGTGLMAQTLQAPYLVGVDLSAHMLDYARKKKLYSALFCEDLLHFLQHTQDKFDLIVAADVYVYIGDLIPHFKAVAQRLLPQGYYSFTLQAHLRADEPRPFLLGEDLRFTHSPSFIRAALEEEGFKLRHLTPCVTRLDAGKDVPGFVCVAQI